MSKNFGKSAATDAPSFTFNVDPNPSTKKKDGTPFKPCPRTDCVGLRTKHKQLEWQIKEANITIKATEGVAKARLAQSESYDQRLQAAHIELAAFESIVAQLEARYIEEKQKNEKYADLEAKYIEEEQNLEEKYFVLKQKMAQTSAEDLELISELRKQIADLKQNNQSIDAYIKHAEVQIAEREEKCNVRDQDRKKREDEIRDLRTKALTYARETKRLTEEHQKAQDEAAKLRFEVTSTREAMEELQTIHVQEKAKLEEKVKVEEKRLEDFRNDAREIQKENEEARAALEKTEVEVKELRVQLEVVTEELKTKPSTGRTNEDQLELAGYIDMINGLIQQLKSLEEAQQPRFDTRPRAYKGTGAAGGKPPSEEGDSASTRSTSSSEDESTDDEEEDKLPFSVQLIHKIQRLRGDRGRDSGFDRKPIIQIKEVHVPGPEIIVKVPGTPVEVQVPVPGPIQYVDREIPVPGPTVYVDVPGREIQVPGPVRYTPFRVFAHDPIVCWFLVEFNFLILFCHWLKRILSVLSYIPATLLARSPYVPSPPEDESSSDESGAEGAADADRTPRPAPSLLSVLFNPRRGRLPDTWHTFRGLAFHGVVYGIIWLSFTAVHERKVWIAENETSRKWLQQLLAQKGSNGFLGLNQILPQTINRQLDIWRFDLMEYLGIPVTFQFPG
ncbi:c51cab37-867c-4e93-b801-2660c613d0f9 [Sclerotinia trifoliorum]|uniref:C51cab37-867c-4e93-b801-2660c613d0f9 n=1 Tax=Sclerotinia trifoliorum TaxID=28548 RepID=A0A8H2ZRK7_9HELO|nr:c51cab37-867c-4e93-b801-2660c613d0f9 [Sclerotinia trifoliorum]